MSDESLEFDELWKKDRKEIKEAYLKEKLRADENGERAKFFSDKYLKEKERAERAESEIKSQKKHYEKLFDELSISKSDLESRLKIARAALKKIAKHFGTDYCDGNTMIAHEALTAIGTKERG